MCEFLKDSWLDIMLFGLSVWIIPKIITRREKRKKRRVVALALGGLIRDIDNVINSIDFVAIDILQCTILRLKEDGQMFITLAVAFNKEQVLSNNKNIISRCNSTVFKDLTLKEGLDLCKQEYKKIEVLNTSLTNIITTYPTLLSDDIINSISTVLYSINAFKHHIESNMLIYNYFIEKEKEEAIKINIATLEIKDIYNSIFELQNVLLSCTDYFTCTDK